MCQTVAIVEKVDTISQIVLFARSVTWYRLRFTQVTLQIAVKGYITKVNSRDAFITEMLGIYIKDSYDFSAENEPLGVWSKNGIMNKTQTLLYMGFYNQNMWKELTDGGFSGSVPIYNKNFREWQEKWNEGGDFIVFSDILCSYPMQNDRVIYL